MREFANRPPEFMGLIDSPKPSGPSEPPPERETRWWKKFVRLAVGATAVIGVEGCASVRHVTEDAKTGTELASVRRSLPQAWERAVEAAAAAAETDKAVKEFLGDEGVRDLVEIIRMFDVERYLESLAKISKVPITEIQGRIKQVSFHMPSGGDGSMAFVDFNGHLHLNVGEWMKHNGFLHQPTIHAVIRHELAHSLSFNYNAADPSQRIPWIDGQRQVGENNLFMSGNFYEGATEAVAIFGELAEGQVRRGGVESGYRGGETLSAFLLGELAGRDKFVESYLRQDVGLLAGALNKKYGRSFALRITLPASIGIALDLSGGEVVYNSLGILHNAYKFFKNNPEALNSILERAWQVGIAEKTGFSDTNGLQITTHMFAGGDADNYPWRLDAVAETPRVYRLNKAVDPWSNRPITERVRVIINRDEQGPDERNNQVHKAAQTLRRNCAEKDPKVSHSEVEVRVGLDSYITERLRQLNNVPAGSTDFKRLSDEISQHARALVESAAQEIYELAGVTDLVVR